MEDLSEGHSEGNKSAPESNKKRTVKSRAQVDALEKFYEEHKYPSELMKAEFAKSVGLTEKQVSGWFCHRRLKDKKLLNGQIANGRQDRSSGIVQDRGSGLKQDSCGSTKQGDNRNFDPREVESKRLTTQEYAARDVNYEFGGHFTGQDGRSDDTSSGTSSSEQNIHLHHDKVPLSVGTSRSERLMTPVELKGERARVGPSGYLKVKGQVENAAITAVKRQLGRNYRVDGPPLAVEFDPLPLGAFETPMQEANDGSYYTEESSLPRPSHRAIVHKDAHRAIVHKDAHRAISYGYNLKTSSHNSDVDGTRIKRACVSDDSETYFQPKRKHKSPVLSYGGESLSGKSLVMDVQEGSMIEAPVFESRYPYQKAKHGSGRIAVDAYTGQHYSSPYNARVNNIQPETRMHNYKETRTKTAPSQDFENSSHKSYEHLGVQQKGPSRRITKEVKLFGERIAANDDFGSPRARVLPKDEIRVSNEAAKRANNGFLQPHHHRRASPVDAPSWTHPASQIPRSAADVPSSFSEDDETAETSSEG